MTDPETHNRRRSAFQAGDDREHIRSLPRQSTAGGRSIRDVFQLPNPVAYRPREAGNVRLAGSARPQPGLQFFIGNDGEIVEKPADIVNGDSILNVFGVLAAVSPLDHS